MCILYPYSTTPLQTVPLASEAKTTRVLSREEARQRLEERGISIAKWAKSNGLNPNTVSDLLNGRKKGVRGESHNAAVLLGLKRGKVGGQPATAMTA